MATLHHFRSLRGAIPLRHQQRSSVAVRRHRHLPRLVQPSHVSSEVSRVTSQYRFSAVICTSLCQVRFLRHIRGDVHGDFEDSPPSTSRFLHPHRGLRSHLLHPLLPSGKRLLPLAFPTSYRHISGFITIGASARP